MPDASQPDPLYPVVETLDPALVAALTRKARADLAEEVAAHCDLIKNERITGGSVATLVCEIACPPVKKGAAK